MKRGITAFSTKDAWASGHLFIQKKKELQTHTKMNSRYMTDLNVKHKSITFGGENKTTKNIWDLALSS